MPFTAQEILHQTLTTFSSHNRGIDAEDHCQYLTDDGRMCAVGRCMSHPGRMGPNVPVTDVHWLDRLLKPEYRGHPEEFWEMLQILHDDDRFWDEHGPTEQGHAYAAKIEQELTQGELL